MLGALIYAGSIISSAEAATSVNTDRHTSVTVQDQNKTNAESDKDTDKKKLSIKERVYLILHPVEEEPIEEPQEAVSDDNLIMGRPVATQEQCVKFLLKNNPRPKLNVSAEELVSYYYEEGNHVGIRPDIAFAQALKETGFFSYGGTVVPAQNNYCGLGTTSATVQGAYFVTPRIGVRAHIQHLLAYASTEKPDYEIVDPRYQLVRNTYGSNTLTMWSDLNGRWAVPGVGYGQSILSDYYQGILNS